MDWEYFDAYAAGVLDADGCITIVKAKRGGTFRHQLRIEVSMCCQPLVRRFQEEYGGCVTHRPLHTLIGGYNRIRDIWMWIVAAQKAASFLRKVQPYLVVKAEEAAIALDFQSGMVKSIGVNISKKEYDRRERLRSRCSELKRQRYSYSTKDGPGASSSN